MSKIKHLNNIKQPKTVSNMQRAKAEALKDLTGVAVKEERDENGLAPAIPQFAKTEKFKKLKAKWYAKLKHSGFEDIEAKSIETDRQSSVMLNGINSTIAKRLAESGNAEYYRMFDAFVHHSKPDSDSEGDIFVHKIAVNIAEGHTNGLTMTQIAQSLNKQNVRNPWKRNYSQKPYWHRSYVFKVFVKVVKPWVKQFNRQHPMGTQYQGLQQDAFVDDIMLKEPTGYKD